MSSVDNRVVKMSMDTGQFASAANTTIGILGKLSDSLRFAEGTRGLEDVSNQMRKVDTSTLANGVSSIASHFSALEVVGITALANLANSAVNTARTILSSFTVAPIMDGFREYETKMGAIQTIMTNTQGGIRKTINTANTGAKSVGRSASSAASAVDKSAIAANEALIESLRKTSEEALKSFDKTAKAQMKILSDNYDKKLDDLSKANDKELRAFEQLADDEQELLKDKYDKQKEALKEATSLELETLKSAHQEKLKLYDEEYMAKLKVLDEAKYNDIKKIDDEINAIKDLTKADKEAKEKADQEDRKAELQKRIDEAKTIEARQAAEKKLIDYIADLELKQTIKDREAKIAELEQNKKDVQAQYKEKEQALKTEYENKKTYEAEVYKQEADNIKAKQEAAIAAISAEYKERKKELDEQIYQEKEAIKDIQKDKVKSLKDIYDQEKTLLDEKLDAEKDAIKEKYDAEIKALQDVNKELNAVRSGGGGGGGASIGGGGLIETGEVTKASTLEEINAALAELNDYADKTIYNFAQMTDNVGKFTAAGLGLEDSVKTVKGMANVAAGFGVDANRMAGATYQMSQALAAGVIKLQDWKSLENSGMGGSMLQQALLKTAEDMGVVVDRTKPFRESLESGWLSSEVFVETMGKMAEDPALLKAATNVTSFTKLVDTMKESVGSGWAVSWENILGDKNQSTALFTSISDGFNNIMGPMADYRNEALKLWNEEGGREAILNGIANVLKTIGKILGPLYNSFKKIIDPWNGQSLVNISKAFESWTTKIDISDTAMENLSKTFDGIFSIASLVGKGIGAVVSALANLIPLSKPILEGILSITAPIGEFITKLNDSAAASGVFSRAMRSVYDGLSNVSETIGNALKSVGGWVAGITEIDVSGLTTFTSKVISAFTPLDSMAKVTSKVIGGIQSALEKFVPVVVSLVDKVWGAMTKLSKGIIDSIGGKGTGLTNIVSAGVLGAIVLGVKKVLDIFKNLGDNVGSIVDTVTELFDGVKGSIEAFQNGLKAETLLKTAGAIALLAGSLVLIASIDSAKLISSLTSMGVLFGELVGTMALFEKVGDSAKIGLSVIALATSMLILSNAMKNLSEISWEDSTKGLLTLGGLMAMMVLVSKTMEKESKGMISSSTSLVIFAKAMDMLSNTMVTLGNMSWEGIAKGLVAIAGSLTILTVALKLMSSNISGATTLVITATALGIFSAVLSKMGSLSLDEIGRGLIAVAGSLIVLAAGLKLISSNISGATTLIIASTALLLFTSVMSKMSSMSWEDIGKSLITIAGSLTILAVALKVMSGNIAGAVALTITAAALALLTPTLVILGSLSLETIAKSLLTLAGVFAVIGVAGLVLGPLTPVLLALSGVIVLLGAACIAVGVGISAFATGMALLAVSGAAGAAALTVIITSLVTLLPNIAIAFGTSLIEVVKVFAENSAELAKAITKALTELIKALTSAIPPLVKLVVTLLSEIIKAIVDLTPKIVDGVLNIITKIIESLSINLPKIAGYIFDFLLNLLTTLLEKFAEAIPEIGTAITNIIVAITETIGTNVPVIVEAVFNMIIAMINGLTNAVETKMPEVRTAIGKLVKAIIKEFGNAVKDAVSIGGDIIGGLIKGISNGIDAVKQAAKNVAESALNAAKEFLDINSPSGEFEDVGMYSDQGMAKGFTKNSGMVKKAAVGVADMALKGMRTAMSAVNDFMNDDISSQPVIRPIMDLSEIQNGAGKIGSIVNGDYGIETSVNSARQISNRLLNRSNNDSIASEPVTYDNRKTEIVNKFNITGDNPRAIADEVSKIIQKQVERRNVIWE